MSNKEEIQMVKNFSDVLNLKQRNGANQPIDLTNSEVLTKFFDFLGGENYVAENYPAVHKTLLEKSNSNTVKDDFAYVLPPGIAGNIVGKDEQNLKWKGRLYTEIGGHYPDGKDTVFVQGRLKDEKNRVFYSTFKKFTGGQINDIEIPIRRDVQDIWHKKELKYITEAEYIMVDARGGIEVVSLSNTNNILFGEEDTLIANFTVEHPWYQNGKTVADGDQLIILYGREPMSGEKEDYKYENNKKIGNKVKTLLPIEGTIEIRKDCPFTFRKDDYFEKAEFNMIFIGDDEPVAKYSNGTLSEYFTFKDNKKIEFKFDEDWANNLDVSVYSSKTTMRLLGSITLKLSYKGYEILTTFIISSTQDKSKLELNWERGGTKFVPMLSIRWGCFAKDTEILMENGTKRKIQEINIGDKVLSDKGITHTIENIYTGAEDNVIRIETESGRELLVTNNHPIETAQGVKCAQELRPSEMVKMNDGLEEIKFVNECEYKNTVYNLKLETPSMIVANDFIAGDFDMQNQNLSTEQSFKRDPFAAEVSEQLGNLLKEVYKEVEV
jgi:hypothetical protein